MHRLFPLVALLLVAVSACKDDPSTPAYWEGRLNDPAKKERLKALDELRQSKHFTETMAPVLHKRLASDKSVEVRAAVARALGALKSPSSVQPLIDAVDFGEGTAEARALNKEIAIGLSALGKADAVPTLLKLLKSKDSYTLIAAIEALAELKAPQAVEPIIELASSDSIDPFIVKTAVVALGELGDKRAVTTLIKAMMKDRYYREASFSLYQIGPPAADALLPIIQRKKDPLFDWVKENKLQEVGLLAKAAQVLGDLHDTRAEAALIELLDYKSEFDDLRLIMRMKAADALGRMRSKAAGKPLAQATNEAEPVARHEYVMALARIGEPDAVGKLLDSAPKGPWESRLESVRGLSMVGDDPRLLDKVVAGEPKAIKDECKGDDSGDPYCEKQDETARTHASAIMAFAPRLKAAAECRADHACWAKKLDDPDVGVRERAAYELGRSGKAEHVEALLGRLGEENLETRLAFIQGVDWLVHDSKDAMATGKQALPKIDAQLAAEKGKTTFEIVNEDLRRLRVKLRRG